MIRLDPTPCLRPNPAEDLCDGTETCAAPARGAAWCWPYYRRVALIADNTCESPAVAGERERG